MPFELSQLIVVSTAEGIDTEGESTWNFNLVQNNDIYIHIAKNKNYKETEIIKNVIIDNFVINSEPTKGEIVIYRPSSDENSTYENIEEYMISDNITYIGEEESNLKELKIANQGGIISLRYSIEDLRYIFIGR